MYKRQVQKLRQGLHQIGLAASGGADEQNVGLLNLDVVLSSCGHTLIVIVYSHGNNLLGVILSDDILVQAGLQLMGSRDSPDIELLPGLLLLRLFLLHLLLLSLIHICTSFRSKIFCMDSLVIVRILLS